MQAVKYGVIGTDDLLRDLHTWDTLMVAGRLHKPVQHIVVDRTVMAGVAANLQAVLATSLFMLPTAFTSEVSAEYRVRRQQIVKLLDHLKIILRFICAQALFASICGTSYLGDVRVGLAEDPLKVQRIVEGSWDRLHDLYQAPLKV